MILERVQFTVRPVLLDLVDLLVVEGDEIRDLVLAEHLYLPGYLGTLRSPWLQYKPSDQQSKQQFLSFFEFAPTVSNMTHDPICKRVCVHAYACTCVCTHALSTRRKMLGAVRISAQEQNFWSNAISHLQFGDAISLSQFDNAVSAMQFQSCRMQCSSCIPALARP